MYKKLYKMLFNNHILNMWFIIKSRDETYAPIWTQDIVEAILFVGVEVILIGSLGFKFAWR